MVYNTPYTDFCQEKNGGTLFYEIDFTVFEAAPKAVRFHDHFYGNGYGGYDAHSHICRRDAE